MNLRLPIYISERRFQFNWIIKLAFSLDTNEIKLEAYKVHLIDYFCEPVPSHNHFLRVKFQGFYVNDMIKSLADTVTVAQCSKASYLIETINLPEAGVYDITQGWLYRGKKKKQEYETVKKQAARDNYGLSCIISQRVRLTQQKIRK